VWLIASADEKNPDARDLLRLLRLRHSPRRRECDDSDYDPMPY
jgi:ribosomal protein L30/L7E